MKTLALLLLLLVSNTMISSAQNPHDTLFSPDITRLSNYGNCERRLELTDFSRQYIADNYFMPNTIYKGKNAAIQVSVYDWDSIVPGDYQLDFDSISRIATWKLYKIGTNDTVYSNNDISILNHQYIPQWGLVVTVYEDTVNYSNYYGSPLVFQAPDTSFFDYSGMNCEWVSGMEDIDNHPYQNWIQVGTDSLDHIIPDTLELYEQVLNGRFSAGKLASYQFLTSPWDSAYVNAQNLTQFDKLGSLDLILTSDTSLWTRCPVLNMDHGSGGEVQTIMNWPSLNKSGLPDNSGTTGMSWFPGYAIDLEFGERLNIAFGEDTTLTSNYGNDGLFNPDSVRYSGGNPVFGGRHWVYIFRNEDRFSPGNNRMPRYDDGNYLHSMLHGSGADKLKVWRSHTWMGSIQPEQGYDFLDCDVILKIRNKYSNVRLDEDIVPFGDTASYQFTIPVSLPNSVNESYFSGVKIYPNPSDNGIFYLENSSETKISSFRLFDLTGKLLLTESILSNNFILNLNDLSSGIYLVNLYDENDSMKTFKLVID